MTSNGLVAQPSSTVSVLDWNERSYFSGMSQQNFTLVANRQTGQVSVMNPDGTPAAIKAYSIQSAGGSFSPAAWQSFHDQNLGAWAESSAAATQLAEADSTGALLIAPSAGQGIGRAFAPHYAAFGGGETQDLVFHFTRADGSTGTGTVEYAGVNLNNLALYVDPATGATELHNTSPFNVAIDGYTVGSASSSLSVAGWNSLDDQNAAGGDWAEANSSSAKVSELKPTASTLLAPGAVFSLGRLFSAAGGMQDLEFQFVLAGQSAPMMGVVLYQTLPAADFDGDGDVDGADFAVWQRGLGTAAGATKAAGDANGDGAVDAADLVVWQAEFGSGPAALAASQRVPEPDASAMLVIALTMLASAGRASRRATPSGSPDCVAVGLAPV